MTWWHTCTVTQLCRKTDTLVLSQAYVAVPGAVLTFEFPFRTNPVALLTWGQGEGWGCHGNPCWWSNRALGEMSRGRSGGGGGSSASWSLSFYLSHSFEHRFSPVNLSYLFLLLAGFHFNLANKSITRATGIVFLIKLCPYLLFSVLIAFHLLPLPLQFLLLLSPSRFPHIIMRTSS